jgi:RNA polymerase sigma factor (sigma-70 family)
MEERAIRYLIQRNYPMLEQFVLQHNGNQADAEDVFQEALTALILNIRRGSFKGDSSIHTYLFAIGKGIWYKRFRKQTRQRDREAIVEMDEVDTVTAEARLLNEEQRHLLKSVFARLREKCADVLFLWASGYSMKEIADQMDYGSAQVVMNKKNKCLKQLHEQMHHDPSLVNLLKEI